MGLLFSKQVIVLEYIPLQRSVPYGHRCYHLQSFHGKLSLQENGPFASNVLMTNFTYDSISNTVLEHHGPNFHKSESTLQRLLTIKNLCNKCLVVLTKEQESILTNLEERTAGNEFSYVYYST